MTFIQHFMMTIKKMLKHIKFSEGKYREYEILGIYSITQGVFTVPHN
jgi:hypothetical protein